MLVVVLDSENEFRELIKLPRQDTGTQSASTTLAFSPNERLLASANKTSTVRVWDWAAGTMVADICSVVSSNYFSVAFLDDARIAAGNHEGRVLVFNLNKLSEHEATLHGAHSKPVWALAALGTVLVSGSEDGTVAIWDTASFTLTKSIICDGAVGVIMLRSDSEIFVGVSGRQVAEFSSKKDGVQGTYSEHRGDVYGLALRRRQGMFRYVTRVSQAYPCIFLSIWVTLVAAIPVPSEP